MWFPNRSNTNWPVQSQKQARNSKFWIQKGEESYYPCGENKSADQLCFRYADCWVSHGAAHLFHPVMQQALEL